MEYRVPSLWDATVPYLNQGHRKIKANLYFIKEKCEVVKKEVAQFLSVSQVAHLGRWKLFCEELQVTAACEKQSGCFSGLEICWKLTEMVTGCSTSDEGLDSCVSSARKGVRTLWSTVRGM